MKVYKNCQSCAMPLHKDPEGGGTESDGTKSPKYCSYCYGDGNFLQPDISAEEMQVFVKGKLKEMGGVMKLFAGYFSKNIPKLERWNQKG